MIKNIKSISKIFVLPILLLSLSGGNFLFAAATPAQQLEKGKALFAEHKNDEAMDYFIDVLVTGSRKQSEEANTYINMIHNRMGGIANPDTLGDFSDDRPAPEITVEPEPEFEEEDLTVAEEGEDLAVEVEETTTFQDLTSPDALRARALYSYEKLQGMKDSSLERLKGYKGVRVYMRESKVDAIDLDWDVIFNGNRFRPEAMPLLGDIYSLMALTQGAGYVILPPGSYTDDITLGGIRQAMALNSYFVHKGISSGKISYNMGLYDHEPPAKYANLDGISIVFDYDADLPAEIPQAAITTKLPLVSLAVVPVSNEIDPALGQAFAIDYSVIETSTPLDNWVLQVVQHNSNGNFYVVRQLEGFSPVYHQIIWNARKGVIGPALACGKYTVALTAVDMKGQKKTLRRRLLVKCPDESALDAAKAKAKTVDENSICPKCNYKTARLWTKPGRTMKEVPAPAPIEEPQPDLVDPFAGGYTEGGYSDPLGYTDPGAAYTETPGAYTDAPPAYTDTPDAYTDQPAAYTETPAAYTDPVAGAAENPYDMPYEELN